MGVQSSNCLLVLAILLTYTLAALSQKGETEECVCSSVPEIIDYGSYVSQKLLPPK
jgi:hypothetical protein